MAYRALVVGITGLVIAGWLSPVSEAASAANEKLYVANADAGPVTVYDASSSGAVSRSGTLENPNLQNTVWDPWGVTSDRSGSIYVQTFLSDATSFVFRTGTPKPIRVFRGGGPDTRAIAVDSNGFEYIATGESGAEMLVLPPRANGQPATLYSVTPLRTIALANAGFRAWPSILTTDAANNVIVAVTTAQGANEIQVIPGGPNGTSAPIRVIGGPHTGLGVSPDTVSLTYSNFTGRLYVAVSAGASTGTVTHLSVFTNTANGDARPLRTIVGPATGLSGNVVTGIADSQTNGDVYAMVKSAEFSSAGHVGVFGRFAHGNTAPLRTFTDVATGFADAEGIALIRP